MTFDPVNKPSHYAEGRQFETIEVIEDWKLSYRLGNCVKYISRAGRKGDRKQDLEKALWYLQREIEAIERPSQYTPPTDVQYEDVLDYYGQSLDLEEAWPQAAQYLPFEWTGQDVVTFGDDGPVGSGGTDSIFGVNDFWMEEGNFDLYATGWDPSLGPVEIDKEEVDQLLAKKDLDQFDDDEIVSTVERRGMIIGFKKDGSSCILKDGRCV